eukprot:COSAG06_NODE_27691_length_588_cov_0.950920_1_plen_44_part_10
MRAGYTGKKATTQRKATVVAIDPGAATRYHIVPDGGHKALCPPS